MSNIARRALCILFGSPALFAPGCKTPCQMKVANAVCRYLELARRVEADLRRAQADALA